MTSGWHLAPVSPWETFLLVTTPGEMTQGPASVTLFTEGCRAQLHGDPMRAANTRTCPLPGADEQALPSPFSPSGGRARMSL